MSALIITIIAIAAVGLLAWFLCEWIVVRRFGIDEDPDDGLSA